MMFVVVRQGVYDQGVVDVTKNLKRAKESAEKAAAAEPDTYHDFDIRVRDDELGEFCKLIWCFSAKQSEGPRVWRHLE